MPQPEAASGFYRQVQRLQLLIVAAGRKAWSGMRDDFDASWAEVSPGLIQVTAAGQLAAARAATEYVPALLEETSQPDRPDAHVRPQAFAGVAADGRSLPGLIEGAKVQAKRTQSLEVGGRHLDMLLQTIITDAARAATQAEVAVRPHMGFVRMVNPPCCARCAMLAGRFYYYDAGFKRHPQCDCSVIPTTREGWERLSVSADELFNNGHVKGLTKRERDRLAAGDDRNKVINESRDMWRARLAEQRRAEKDAAKAAEAGQPAQADPVARDRQARQGLEDLFASTRSRTEAVRAMRDAGFVN